MKGRKGMWNVTLGQASGDFDVRGTYRRQWGADKSFLKKKIPRNGTLLVLHTRAHNIGTVIDLGSFNI